MRIHHPDKSPVFPFSGVRVDAMRRVPPAFMFPRYHTTMLLLLVRLAFQYVIHPDLATGNVQVFIVSEQLLAQRKLAGITRPGGVAYL
ncbi:hypothetical protein SNB58_23110, partial [Escherichia coli]|nr:hypothetical protein [Escherichia coli]MDZ8908626.1 hypothetical protein [Escherichia coli]